MKREEEDEGLVASRRESSLTRKWKKKKKMTRAVGKDTYGRNIICPQDQICIRVLCRPNNCSRQSKIANFKPALTIHQHIARLQIPMQDACRVHIVHAAQQLKHKKLDIRRVQRGGTINNAVQIAGHELEHNKGVIKPIPVGRDEDVLDLDDVLMPGQHAQKLELAQDARGHGVGVQHLADALDGHRLARGDVRRRRDDAVRALADDLVERVAVREQWLARRFGARHEDGWGVDGEWAGRWRRRGRWRWGRGLPLTEAKNWKKRSPKAAGLS